MNFTIALHQERFVARAAVTAPVASGLASIDEDQWEAEALGRDHER